MDAVPWISEGPSIWEPITLTRCLRRALPTAGQALGERVRTPVGTGMYTDVFFCICVVLCTYRSCDEPIPALGIQPNIYKQDSERCICSSGMWRWVTGYLVPDVSRQHAPLICNSPNIQVTLKAKGSGPRCTVAPYRYIDQKKKTEFLPTTLSYLWQGPSIISNGTPTSCSDARFPLLP